MPTSDASSIKKWNALYNTLVLFKLAYRAKMKYRDCYLPNGQKVCVAPSFGGFRFVLNNEDPSASFPPEWTISIRTEDAPLAAQGGEHREDSGHTAFIQPSLNGDSLFLSSMSLPAKQDLKPGSASTRQIAMLLWVTFSWYFHEPEPNLHASTTPHVPEPARIIKDWRLRIEQKGILGGKDKMKKLERLGIVACEDASVSPGAGDKSDLVDRMFISQRAFWQLDPRLYLVSLTASGIQTDSIRANPLSSLDAFGSGFLFAAGPKTYGMLLPCHYPPQPLQYTFSQNIRHPIRPKSPRQGEVFYVRYIPSGGKYLTFRVLVLPTTDIRHDVQLREQASGDIGPNLCLDSGLENDVKLLHKWMEERPIDTSLTRKGPPNAQAEFLQWRLSSNNSFPALAC